MSSKWIDGKLAAFAKWSKGTEPDAETSDYRARTNEITCSRKACRVSRRRITRCAPAPRPGREGRVDDRRADGREPSGCALSRPAPTPQADRPGGGGTGLARRCRGHADAHGRRAGGGRARPALPLLPVQD